jgi:Mrp family chromosome partitioning ATPase
LVHAKAISELITRLQTFDWIVIDSPPLGAFADALSLAAAADTIIFVTRTGVSNKSDLKESLLALQGFHIAGVILNACDVARKPYYSYRGST